MAIKDLRKGLPIIGFAKIGVPTTKNSPQRGAPLKLDHIEITGRNKDSDGLPLLDVPAMLALLATNGPTCVGCSRCKDLAKRYKQPLFEKGLPTQIPILLHYNDLELSFPNRYAWHRGRTEFCHGDGVKAERRKMLGTQKIDGRDVERLGDFEPYTLTPCGRECPDMKAPKRCKPKGALRFVLGVQQSLGGLYEFRTTSWNSIANLQNGLELLQQSTGGMLAWIPLFFEISPQTVQPREGPANTAMIARVTFQGTPNMLLQLVQGNLVARAPMMQEIRALEAQIDRTWTVDPDDIGDFRDEFDQEAQQGESPVVVEGAPPKAADALAPPALLEVEEPLPPPAQPERDPALTALFGDRAPAKTEPAGEPVAAESQPPDAPPEPAKTWTLAELKAAIEARIAAEVEKDPQFAHHAFRNRIRPRLNELYPDLKDGDERLANAIEDAKTMEVPLR